MKTQMANSGQDASYQEAKRHIKSYHESGGKILDLSGLGLERIPPELARLGDLTERQRILKLRKNGKSHRL